MCLPSPPLHILVHLFVCRRVWQDMAVNEAVRAKLVEALQVRAYSLAPVACMKMPATRRTHACVGGMGVCV